MPVLDRGDDFLPGRCRRPACRCWSCAASAYGHKTCAAAVAGRLHAHQPGILPVLHVADQNAVLDQHGAVGRRAFVVDGQRAAPLAMVPSSTTVTPLAATCWPIRPAKAEVPLAVEIAFEPVADSLVQHHARPAGAEHDVNVAGRGGHGVEIDQRLAQRLVDARAARRPSAMNSLKALASADAVASRFPAGRRRRRRPRH